MKIIGIILGVIGIGFLIALILALPTMWLWNYLMPSLFGLKIISFWQALAMNVLCTILFKSSGSSSKD